MNIGPRRGDDRVGVRALTVDHLAIRWLFLIPAIGVALTLLGANTVRQWVSVWAMTSLGADVPSAVAAAQAYVAGAIRHGLAIGHGHGPLDHFWTLRAGS